MASQAFDVCTSDSPQRRMLQENDELKPVAESRYSKSTNRRVIPKFDAWTISVLALLLLILLILTFGVIAVAIRLMKDAKVNHQGVLTDSTKGNPLRIQAHYQFLPLSDLNTAPLEFIEKMESLKLQWGETGGGSEVKYYFQIEYAKQDKGAKETILGLSYGHKLVANESMAVLKSPEGEQLGIVYFNTNDGAAVDVTEHLQRVDPGSTRVIQDAIDETASQRTRVLLGKQQYGRYPFNVDPGLPESFFDAYCRYGCGGMAVTFPYYYRPFFGYGFPLVGTEAMFPQGYGGYPAADLLASQGTMSLLQGISSPGVPGGPSNGAHSSASMNGPPVNGGEAVPLTIPV